MIVVSEPTFPGCLIEVKPVALFRMRDEKAEDNKILCVPVHGPELEPHRAPRRPADDAPRRDLALLLDLQDARVEGRPGRRLVPARGCAGVDRARSEAVPRGAGPVGPRLAHRAALALHGHLDLDGPLRLAAQVDDRAALAHLHALAGDGRPSGVSRGPGSRTCAATGRCGWAARSACAAADGVRRPRSAATGRRRLKVIAREPADRPVEQRPARQLERVLRARLCGGGDRLQRAADRVRLPVEHERDRRGLVADHDGALLVHELREDVRGRAGARSR